MAAFGGVGAFDLPCEIIIHIFSFLSDRDKIRASAVCSRWRECFFSPPLWTDQKLQVRGEVFRGATGALRTPKLEFLMSKFGAFVRELHLDFSPSAELPMKLTDDKFEREIFGSCGLMQSFADPWEDAMHCYLDQVLCVLRSLLNNRNLQSLSLYGATIKLEISKRLYTQEQDSQCCEKIRKMQHVFEQVLAGSRPLKRIVCAFMPGLVTFRTLPSLSDLHGSSLEHLALLDRWAQPQIEDLTTPPSDGPAPPLLRPLDLDRMRSLRSLALDFRHFTSPLCQSLSLGDRAPLLRLSLLLENARLESPPTEVDWRTLVQKSPALRVSLMAVNLRAEDLMSVLKRSLPLERLHIHSHTACTARAVQLISERYCRTLTHLSLIGSEPNVCFPDIRERLRMHPLVLLAWRCRRLSVLALRSYAVWAHDLREISRHGGVHLVDLNVPKESIRFRPDWPSFGEEEPMEYLIKEVSLLLGRAWSPALNSSLLLLNHALHFCQEAQSFSTAA